MGEGCIIRVDEVRATRMAPLLATRRKVKREWTAGYVLAWRLELWMLDSECFFRDGRRLRKGWAMGARWSPG